MEKRNERTNHANEKRQRIEKGLTSDVAVTSDNTGTS